MDLKEIAYATYNELKVKTTQTLASFASVLYPARFSRQGGEAVVQGPG